MATQAQKIKVGVFLLATVGLAVVGILLISGFRTGDRIYYWLEFDESVLGLTAGGLVQYKGVPIGTVENIRVNKDNKARVDIAVKAEKVTLREGVAGRLEIYSLAAGTMCVALDGGSPDAQPLEEGARIPTRPSLVASISSQIGDILQDLNDIVAKVETGLEGLESGDLTRVINQTEDLLAEGEELLKETRNTVTDLRGDLDSSLASVREGVDSYKEFGTKIVDLADEMNKLVVTVQEKIEPLDVADIEASWRTEFEQISARLQTTAETFDTSAKTVLHQTDNVQYALRETLRTMNEALTAIRDLARYLQEDPSAVVLGKGKPKGGN